MHMDAQIGHIMKTFRTLPALLGVALFTAMPGAYAAASDASSTPPPQLVKDTPKGQLHNPYKDTDAKIVAEGQTLFRSYGCSGCHGGDGGGGMCPPLTKGNWIYGGDDDTLFRLVTLGSDALKQAGYSRKGFGTPVGPMPPMGTLVKTSDDLWKILAFVRSRFDGDPGYKFGDPPNPK